MREHSYIDPAVDTRLDELRQVKWFSSVGQALPANQQLKFVSSWNEAFQWTEDPVSWWCNVEGKKLLYENLAKTHYERFSQWNNVARAILPKVKDLLEEVVFPSAQEVAFTEKAKTWIQSQILSSVLELVYRDCVEVTVFTNQIEYYVRGHFPCGWHAESPEGFPNTSILVVF